ncbi:C4-dicarboxylate ABC transporter [Virgibacillus pantothenticus]|uniref:TRAP transporter substrate-binding protein n=1 Tax=Virgibacillus pantothenticus TaxID=1473 RepID=UPI001B0C9C37|nr:TRAP transporter substrate-binding protein [Virgibacillus pantothenticus]GIP63879.1 C4-dicarboxylate ABC transporter [Virgibacillus pantothenticus]
MKIYRLITLMFIMVAFSFLAACTKDVGSIESSKLKIIAAHNQTSPDTPYQTGMLKFKEVIEEESNGSMEVEVHAGTIGTEEAELVEKLQLGAADVVLVSPGFMTQTGIREVDLFSVPYLFRSYEHWLQVVDGDVGKEMAQIINDKSNNSFKLLGYWTAGVRHFYGKKPLESMDDLQGMSLRTQTSGVIGDFWEATGAIPSSISWGELYQGLQQGVVDSSENAYPFFVQQSHHTTENGKFITETAHDYTTRFLLINGEKFAMYSKEQQDIIMKAAKASVTAEREATNRQDREYKEKAMSEGALVNEINREPLINLAKPIQDAFAEEIGAQEMLQDIRDLENK